MTRPLLILAALLACGSASAEAGSYPSPASTPPTPSGAYGDCHNPEYIVCRGPCEVNYALTAVQKPPNGKCPDGSDPVANASAMDLWRRNHHHVAYDYASIPMDDPLGSACAPCGGTAARSETGDLDHLIVQRTHRYRDFWIWSSFGPGVFCNYDVKLELSPRQWDWQPMINLFDPQENGFAIYLMEYDHEIGHNVIDGVYHDPTSRRVQRLELRDAAGAQPDQHLATHAILTTITGETLTFEIVRTQASAEDPLRSGRFTRFQDRNGNATVIAYAHPADATDADLGGDRTRLWQIASVTDMYGLTATFRYAPTRIASRWCVDRITLPNGEHLDYSYSTATPGWGLVGGSLRRVGHPDGSASTFDLQVNRDRLGGLIVRYDDHVAGSGHGRKDAYLTHTTWTDPDTGVVSPSTPNLCTKIVNGGELAYLVWDEPADAQVFYAYLGGGKLMRVRNDGARDPIEVAYATRFDLSQPGTTYAWEIYSQQVNDGDQRLSSRTDSLGRTSSYRYDATSRALTGVTHPDGTEDRWTYGPFHLETQHVDRLGRITAATYAANGDRLTRTVARGTPAEATTRWTYNLRGQPLTRTDALGRVTSYAYDARGFLVSITDPPDIPGGTRSTRSWTYDVAGRLVASTDGGGRITTYEHDRRNRHIRTRYADGSFEEIAFGTGSLASLPVSRRDRNGTLTTYGYDASLRRVLTTTAAGTPVAVDERCAYVPGTRLESSCTLAGDRTERVFDHRQRLIATTVRPRTDRALTTARVIDAANRVVREIDAFGRATRYLHDVNDRVVRTVQELVPGGIPPAADPATLPRILSANAPYLVTERACDAEGQELRRSDGRGVATTMTYDAQGRVVVLIEADGTAVAARTETTYDAVGNVLEVRHPRHFTEAGGFRTVSTWTGRDLLAGRTEAAGRPEAGTTRWTWTTTRQVATMTDSRGMTTRYSYAACCDRLVQVQDPAFAVTRYAYDAHGDVVAVTDGNGITTTRAYDARHRVARRTDGTGATTTLVYDDDLDDGVGLDAGLAPYLVGLGIGDGADGSAVTTIDPLGHRSTVISDGLGRVIRTIDGNGNGAITVHDTVVPVTPGAPGALVATTRVDALGHRTSQRADGAGRILATLDAENRLATAGCDAAGNRVRSRDANGVGEDSSFDERGRCTRRTDTVGATISAAYDAHGNQVTVTDALGHTSRSTWDARDRLASTTDALGARTLFAYDAMGNRTRILDAEGGMTAYAYDSRGLLVSETFPPPTGGTLRFAWDAGRRLVARIDQSGRLTTHAYDRADRLIARRYPDRRDDAFTYDAAGRLTAASSARYANTVLRAYDAGDRMTSESLVVRANPLLGTTVRHDLHYAYDAADRRVLLAHPDGRRVTRAYTARGQLQRVAFEGATVATRAYDAGGRLVGTSFGNGLVESRAWRADDLVRAIATPGVASLAYAYDADRRVTAQTDALAPATSQRFAYDALDRLVGWSDGAGGTQAWSLSPVHDWRTTTIGGVLQSRTHSPAHELTAIDGVPLTYDGNRNLATDHQGRRFTWDVENRLASASVAGRVATYAYDALDRRVSKSVDGVTTTIVSAGAQEVWEVESDELVVDGPALDGEGGGTAARPLGGVLEGAGVIRVDFQPAGAATAAGYVADTGLAPGPRVGAPPFGWRDGAHPHASEANRVPLQQWDTTHAMQPPGGPAGVWEIDLPNGTYPVVVVMGDAARRDMVNDVAIENHPRSDPDPYDPAAPASYEQGDFDGYAQLAQVLDGRLTIAPRAGSANARICFIEIGTAGGGIDAAAQARLEGMVRRMTWATAGAPTQRRRLAYVHGNGLDDLLAMATPGGILYHHGNHVRSTAAVTDASRAVVERYRYDAYGHRTVTDAAGAPRAASAIGNRIGFTGRAHDAESGLSDFRRRMYHPGIGRFAQRDRLAYPEGYNDYAAYFVPNRVDPFGLTSSPTDACPESGGGGGCKGECVILRTRPIVRWSWQHLNDEDQGAEVIGWYVIPSQKSCTCRCVWDRPVLGIKKVGCAIRGDTRERPEMKVPPAPVWGGGGGAFPFAPPKDPNSQWGEGDAWLPGGPPSNGPPPGVRQQPPRVEEPPP